MLFTCGVSHFSLKDGSCIRSHPLKSVEIYRTMVLSRDNRWIFFGTSAGTVQMISYDDFAISKTQLLSAHSSYADVALSGNVLLVAGYSYLAIWDVDALVKEVE